jgi:hypothetical protein
VNLWNPRNLRIGSSISGRADDLPSVLSMSSDPTSADPELSHQRGESAKQEKQPKGYEKDGESENEK